MRKAPVKQPVKRNWKPFLLLLGVVLVGLVAGARFLPNNPITQLGSHIKKISTHTTLNPFAVPIPDVLDAPPEKLRESLAAAYRLKPDKRFLLAVGEIHRFLTGEKAKPARAEFNDGQWTITYKGQSIGQVPELPDFDDFLKVLVPWTKSLEEQHPVNLLMTNPSYVTIREYLKGFLAPHLIAALREIDKEWNDNIRDPRLFKWASRAMAQLVFQMEDQLEIGDPLSARALAFLALTRALTQEPVVEEECLLAHALGYSSHAAQVSKRLPRSDSLRAYMNKEDAALKKIAEAEDSSWQSKYLWLTRLSQSSNGKPWLQWLESAFADTPMSLPIMKTGLAMGSFETNRQFPRMVQQLILLEMEKQTKDQAQQPPNEIIEVLLTNNQYYLVLDTVLKLEDATLAGRVRRFEHYLEQLAYPFKGPFFDAVSYRTFYRGYFYSTVYLEGLFYMDQLSSRPGTELYIAQLGGTGGVVLTAVKQFATGVVQGIKKTLAPVLGLGINMNISKEDFVQFAGNLKSRIVGGMDYADDLKQWFDHILAAEYGNGDADDLMEDVLDLASLGGKPLVRSYKDGSRYLKGGGDSARITGLKFLVTRLDSRVDHRYHLASRAHENLMDSRLAEKLFRSAFQTGPYAYEYLEAWYRYYTRDVAALKEILSHPLIDTATRLRALSLLDLLKVSSAYLDKHYRALHREFPESWEVNRAYATFLGETKQYRRARSVMQTWLNLKVPTTGLQHTVARNTIAELYYEEGLYKKGWEWIESELKNSGHGGTLAIAGKTLEKLDRIEDAARMFVSNYQRYPNSRKRMLDLIEFLWRHKQYEAAGKIIAANSRVLIRGKVGELADRFSKNFASRPADEGMKAFAHIQKAESSPFYLEAFAKLPHDDGAHELAFKIQSQFRTRSMGQLQLITKAYIYMKSWKGRKAALQWLRKAVPPDYTDYMAMFLFNQKQYPLLWSFTRSAGEYTWLTRAAASLEYNKISKRDRGFLKRYYQSDMADSQYHLLGRYLLGLASKKEVIQAMTTPKKICEMAFFLGFKALSEGKFDEANDWFRISVETNLPNNGEYRWALETLTDLKVKGMALSLMLSKDNPWKIH